MDAPATPWSSSSTDSSLIRRAQQRDQVAWHQLVNWAGPLVYFWCRQARLAPPDGDDIFQDVFVSVYRHLDKFAAHQAGGSFRGWLLTITRSKIVDLARRRLKNPEADGGSENYRRLLMLTTEQLSSSEMAGPDSRRARLRRAVELIREFFDERTWAAFWRTAVDGQTATAVANELGMTPAAVRKAKSRVIARLRSDFEGLLDE